jgi:predicted MPP superfamily phosphohydrolase
MGDAGARATAGESARHSTRIYPYGSLFITDPRVKAPVTFAHVTDLHLTPALRSHSLEIRHAIAWWDLTFNRPHRVLPELLRQIKEQDVDFVFFGGDNIDCYDESAADRIVELTAKHRLKPYFHAGNHDWESPEMRYVRHTGSYDASVRDAALRKLCAGWSMPKPYYSFETKGIRFIVLDPPYMKRDGKYAGFFEDEQAQWCLGQLQFDGPIVIVHHIPFNCQTLQERMLKIVGGPACVAGDPAGTKILSGIERCPNVLGTFTGHLHFRSEDRLGQSFQFMTAPASDLQWRYVKISSDPAPMSLRAPGRP